MPKISNLTAIPSIFLVLVTILSLNNCREDTESTIKSISPKIKTTSRISARKGLVFLEQIPISTIIQQQLNPNIYRKTMDAFLVKFGQNCAGTDPAGNNRISTQTCRAFLDQQYNKCVNGYWNNPETFNVGCDEIIRNYEANKYPVISSDELAAATTPQTQSILRTNDLSPQYDNETNKTQETTNSEFTYNFNKICRPSDYEDQLESAECKSFLRSSFYQHCIGNKSEAEESICFDIEFYFDLSDFETYTNEYNQTCSIASSDLCKKLTNYLTLNCIEDPPFSVEVCDDFRNKNTQMALVSPDMKLVSSTTGIQECNTSIAYFITPTIILHHIDNYNNCSSHYKIFNHKGERFVIQKDSELFNIGFQNIAHGTFKNNSNTRWELKQIKDPISVEISKSAGPANISPVALIPVITKSSDTFYFDYTVEDSNLPVVTKGDIISIGELSPPSNPGGYTSILISLPFELKGSLYFHLSENTPSIMGLGFNLSWQDKNALVYADYGLAVIINTLLNSNQDSQRQAAVEIMTTQCSLWQQLNIPPICGIQRLLSLTNTQCSLPAVNPQGPQFKCNIVEPCSTGAACVSQSLVPDITKLYQELLNNDPNHKIEEGSRILPGTTPPKAEDVPGIRMKGMPITNPRSGKKKSGCSIMETPLD